MDLRVLNILDYIYIFSLPKRDRIFCEFGFLPVKLYMFRGIIDIRFNSILDLFIPFSCPHHIIFY